MTATENLTWALSLNAGAAWLGYRTGVVSRSGAIGGAVIGATIYFTAGLRAWLLLLATLGAAHLASRFRWADKATLGIAQENGGRRGLANAAANCGVAVLAAVAGTVTVYRREALLAFVAALVAAASDTVASEVGKGSGRAPVLATTLTRVAPGTPGAMTLVGTLAGLFAAMALAGLALLLELMPASATLAVVAGATVGALVESVLAAALEARGLLRNEALNLINTVVAVLVALAAA